MGSDNQYLIPGPIILVIESWNMINKISPGISYCAAKEDENCTNEKWKGRKCNNGIIIRLCNDQKI
jgi:hypothetical protein